MPKKESSAEVSTQRERLGRGEQLEAGWCFDPDREDDIFRCGERETAVAEGRLSVSFMGDKVTNLETGEMTEGEATRKFAGTMTIPTAATTAAETKTTDNATGGGGTRGGGSRA